MTKPPSNCATLEEQINSDLAATLKTPFGLKRTQELAGNPRAEDVKLSLIACGDTMIRARLHWIDAQGETRTGSEIDYTIMDGTIGSHKLDRFIRAVLKSATKN